MGNDLVRRCGGDWGSSSPRRQTPPSPQLVEFKMSESEVPITIAQRVVIKFLTNEKLGPNKFGVDYAHNTENQHYRRRK